MRPATAPPEHRSDSRLLVIHPATASWEHHQTNELPELLQPGDLVVVNDAATLPASLFGRGPLGEELELRLTGAAEGERWQAALLGAGDWHTPTEHRPPPPTLRIGDRLTLGPQLCATVALVSALSPRLIELQFDRSGAALWDALYAHGRPVQYSYLKEELPLWSVQTVYGGRPWAAEMPSAGRPLSWELLLALKRRGIEVAWLTHAAGLSSTGDPALDSALPLPERYEIPASTVAAIARVRLRRGRLIAVGTTVVRALEGAIRNARQALGASADIQAGSGWTDLRLEGKSRLSLVDGILTGMHGPGESHFSLLSAFAPAELLAAAWEQAGQLGYKCHEFGDLCLL